MHHWQAHVAALAARWRVRRPVDVQHEVECQAAGDAESHDTVIVGAGLSGIGSAAHLQRLCPGHRFILLEARERLGGTWDLFRFPGVRADSDIYTFGYRFKPWKGGRTLADGESIRRYLAETAAERGIDRQIRFGHRVVTAEWSSQQARWMLTVEQGPKRVCVRIACRFLLVCSGYYRHDQGHEPEFEGKADFQGQVVHPQFWPGDLDVAGKRVVVIGSGATAVTLVPALAGQGARVTLLQRSPSYVLAMPSRDRVTALLAPMLPFGIAQRLARIKNIALGQLLFQVSRRRPELMRRLLTGLVRRALPGHDVERHFAPRYKPWEQRLCITADGDLYEALRSGRAEIVTDEIERMTPSGIRLQSGRQLEADLIVSATGLELCVLGDIAVKVDGRPVEPAGAMVYKGMMYGGVPNLIYTFGYTHASWTLRADLTALYTCRLLRYLDRHGWHAATPRADPAMPALPFVDFSSSYFQRALHLLPRQGERAPWRLTQNYLIDWPAVRFGRIADGVLEFSRRER